MMIDETIKRVSVDGYMSDAFMALAKSCIETQADSISQISNQKRLEAFFALGAVCYIKFASMLVQTGYDKDSLKTEMRFLFEDLHKTCNENGLVVPELKTLLTSDLSERAVKH
jgi:hypothetical protein